MAALVFRSGLRFSPLWIGAALDALRRAEE